MTTNKEGVFAVGLARMPLFLPMKLLVVCCLAGLYSIQADASGLTNNRHLNLRLIPVGYGTAKLLPLKHRNAPYTQHLTVLPISKK